MAKQTLDLSNILFGEHILLKFGRVAEQRVAKQTLDFIGLCVAQRPTHICHGV